MYTLYSMHVTWKLCWKYMAKFGNIYQNYRCPDPFRNLSYRYFPMLQNDTGLFRWTFRLFSFCHYHRGWWLSAKWTHTVQESKMTSIPLTPSFSHHCFTNYPDLQCHRLIFEIIWVEPHIMYSFLLSLHIISVEHHSVLILFLELRLFLVCLPPSSY